MCAVTGAKWKSKRFRCCCCCCSCCWRRSTNKNPIVPCILSTGTVLICTQPLCKFDEKKSYSEFNINSLRRWELYVYADLGLWCIHRRHATFHWICGYVNTCVFCFSLYFNDSHRSAIANRYSIVVFLLLIFCSFFYRIHLIFPFCLHREPVTKLKPSASGLNGFLPHSPLLCVCIESHLTKARSLSASMVALCDSRKYISHSFQFLRCRFVYIHIFASENVYLRFVVDAKAIGDRGRERENATHIDASRWEMWEKKNETKTTRKSTNSMTSFICRRPFVLCFLLLIFAVSHARARSLKN